MGQGHKVTCQTLFTYQKLPKTEKSKTDFGAKYHVKKHPSVKSSVLICFNQNTKENQYRNFCMPPCLHLTTFK